MVGRLSTGEPQKTRLLIVQGERVNGERGKGEREKGETVGKL